MSVYYNEIDPFAAQWLKNLCEKNLITSGNIDERSIKEVKGEELNGVIRSHFFAGIGGWDLALAIAGWPKDRQVWTGSCPCQPFSVAGRGGGVNDERHLWPEFFRLISECRPYTIFGEQVAGKAGLSWLDGVFADLEGNGYTCGVSVIGAHSVGAPHMRKRIYWVANSYGGNVGKRKENEWETESARRASPSRLAENTDSQRWGGRRDGDSPRDDGQVQAAGLRAVGELANNNNKRQQGEGCPEQGGGSESLLSCRRGPWDDYRIIQCKDGKSRRTGSRVFPLAYGFPRGVGTGGSWRKGLARSASHTRKGMLKGSGNAIVPELAAQFISAYMDIMDIK